MRLRSGDGTVVDLHPLRYQFGPSPEPGDWDANWLVVAAHVALPDGRSWSATDPCLTTWEARELGSWLRGILAEHLDAATSTGADSEKLLDFTEPDLAFSRVRRGVGSVTIRVHLAAEFGPPWRRNATDGGSGSAGLVVELEVADAVLAEAAASWQRELDAFPLR